MKFYTDGSYSAKGRKGGWAFVVVDDNRIVEEKGGSLKDTTCNRCELTAIIRAIEYAIDKELEYFEIVTDSKYCQQGLTEWAAEWARRDWKTTSGRPVANVDLWKKIESLLEFVTRFKVSWVRGHNGNHFNERADTLAFKSIR